MASLENTTQETYTISASEKEISSMIKKYRLQSNAYSEIIRDLGLLLKKLYEENKLSNFGKIAYENSKKSNQTDYDIAIGFERNVNSNR
ncbi:hypothetical protein [Priestia aryabhattai]